MGIPTCGGFRVLTFFTLLVLNLGFKIMGLAPIAGAGSGGVGPDNPIAGAGSGAGAGD